MYIIRVVGLCLLHVTIKKHGDVNDVHQHGDVDDVHHPGGWFVFITRHNKEAW